MITISYTLVTLTDFHNKVIFDGITNPNVYSTMYIYIYTRIILWTNGSHWEMILCVICHDFHECVLWLGHKGQWMLTRDRADTARIVCWFSNNDAMPKEAITGAE